MGEIRVSAAELKTKAGELESLNNNLKTNVTDLEQTEQNLVNMWDGEAKNEFHNAFTRDKTQMTNFTTLIEKYVATLENIAAKYEAAEAANVSTANTRKYN